VNQGSPLSPGFFDIYFEDFLREWKTRVGDNDLWYRGYADDLVFLQTERDFEKTFPIFQDLAKEYNLVINKKKSGIFFIGKGLTEKQ
jgi:Reverse transcriptase (RNA-dependent DNA polymerase)